MWKCDKCDFETEYYGVILDHDWNAHKGKKEIEK